MFNDDFSANYDYSDPENDCYNCPYKGIETCKNQCLEIIEIVNPVLKFYLERK